MVLSVPVAPAKPTLWPCSICGIARACTAVGRSKPSDTVAAQDSGDSWSADQSELQRRALADGSLGAAPLSKLRAADSREAARMGLRRRAVHATRAVLATAPCLPEPSN